MNSVYISVIGFTAGSCGVVAFLPQVVKVIITKSTKDLALYMWVIMAAATGLWTVYGILKPDIPILIANGIQLALQAIVLSYKLRYG